MTVISISILNVVMYNYEFLSPFFMSVSYLYIYLRGNLIVSIAPHPQGATRIITHLPLPSSGVPPNNLFYFGYS